jgi:hypothetical protein
VYLAKSKLTFRKKMSPLEVAVKCENLTKHVNTMCGRMQSLVCLKQVVHVGTTGLQRVKETKDYTEY